MNKQTFTSLSRLKPLVLASAVSALVACGGGNNNESDGGNSSSSSTPQSSSSQPQSSTPASSSSVSSVVSSSSSSVTPPDPVAVFSDDFEAGASLGSIWDEDGNIQVSTERAFSGSRSVKFVADDRQYNRNYITLDLNGTEVQDEMYGRMMIWVDRPDEGNGGDFTFIQAEGNPKSSSNAPNSTMVMYRYRVDAFNSNGNLMANYDTWLDSNQDGNNEWNTDCWDHSNTQLPRETWSCVEWYFDKDNNEMRFWLNEQEISEIHIYGSGEGCGDPNRQSGMWTAPEKFDRVHIGIEQYHNGVEARTVYVDDVVVDTRKVGCPTN